MEFQHVNVKLFIKNTKKDTLELLVPVFHSWIQNQSGDELLLDVADYRHVPAGPGVILIGHQGDYSVDNAGGRLGVRYNRKGEVLGSNQDRLNQAALAALTACRRLGSEPTLEDRIQFNGHEIEVFINDRLIAPNTPQTRAEAEPELRTFFSNLFGTSEYTMTYAQDPRSLFSVHAVASKEFDAATLLNNLNSTALTSPPR